MARKINYIIVHCTATPEGRWVTNEEITRWHRARGFRTIGYHYVVYLDGTVHAGRPENEAGAHCLGRNADSVGVCYVGGSRQVRQGQVHQGQRAGALARPLRSGGAVYRNHIIIIHESTRISDRNSFKSW